MTNPISRPIPFTYIEQFEARYNLAPFTKDDADGSELIANKAREHRFKLWFNLADIATTYQSSEWRNPTILAIYEDFYHKLLTYLFNIHPLKANGWMERGRGDIFDDADLLDAVVKAITYELIPNGYFTKDERELGLMALEIVKTYAVEIHPRLVGEVTDPSEI